MIIILSVAGYVVYRLILFVLESREALWPRSQALQATYFHCDIGDKILDMMDDSFVNEKDWRELLPVCEYADAWFASTHPFIKRFDSKADFVRAIMRD